MVIESKVSQTPVKVEQLSLTDRLAAVAPKTASTATKTIAASTEQTPQYLQKATVVYDASDKKPVDTKKVKVHGDIFSKPEHIKYDKEDRNFIPAVVYDVNKGHVDKRFGNRVAHLAPNSTSGLGSAPVSNRLITLRMGASDDSYLWN